MPQQFSLVGEIGSVPSKDADFRKIPLKVLALENYHPKTAPLLTSTTAVNWRLLVLRKRLETSHATIAQEKTLTGSI